METKSAKKKRYTRTSKKGIQLPFTVRNYQIFAAGMVVLLLGYWALATGPVDGFFSLSLAPILLVIGYCVLIPLAILFVTKKNGHERQKPN